MRITYQPWGETLAELVAAGRRAEEAGASGLWASELHRSSTITAAALAHGTERVRVGTAIALAFTRSPMTTALEALDLDDISEGRFVLGLGTGVQRLNEDWHHARWGRPARHLSETVRNIRAFWQACADGDAIALEGEHEPMHVRGYQRPFPVRRVDIPVYVAAVGPVMTRLAGRIGDGWISHELCSPSYLSERIQPELANGRASSDRVVERFDTVVSACCSVDDDPTVAIRRAAGLVGFYATVRSYRDFFAFHDLGPEQERVMEAFRAGRDVDHLGNEVGARAVDALTLSGTRDQVLEKVARYRGAADSIKLSPPTHGVSADETRRAQEQIIAMISEIKESVA